MKSIHLILAGSAAVIFGGLIVKQCASPRGASGAGAEASAAPEGGYRARQGAAATVAETPGGEPRGTLRLEGLVLGEDDQPVAGARVVIDARPPLTVVTEGDGSFVFDRLNGRAYLLEARTEHHAAGPVAVRVTATAEPIVLHLGGAQVLVVSALTAESNEPISGATVIAEARDARTAETGETGVATLGPLVAGMYRVSVRATGRSPWSGTVAIAPGAGTTPQRVLLAGSEPLAGSVMADGRPVEGAIVRVDHAAVSSDLAPPELAAATTDAHGDWRIEDGPAGPLRVAASHPRFAPSRAVLVEGAARTAIELTLGPEARLGGTVVDARGEPAPFARVRVAAAGDMESFERPREAICDERGEFLLGGLAPEVQLVVASVDDAASETVEVDLSAGGMRETELVITTDHAIGGRVVDGAGAPLGEVMVVALPTAAARRTLIEFALRGAYADVTTFEGRFRIAGLAPGRYRIVAVPAGASRVMASLPEREHVLARTGDDDVELTLEADGRIVGSVALSDGEVPHAIDVALDGGEPLPGSVGDGSFEVADVAAGVHRVVLSGAGFATTAPIAVTVRAGGVADLGVVRVQSGRVARGRVVDGAGAPVAGATVHIGARIITGTDISSADGLGARRVATDDRGAYEVRGLADGPLTAVAEHPTRGRSVPTPLPASAASLELRLIQTGSLRGRVLEAPPSDEPPVLAARLAGRKDATHTIVLERDGSWYLGNLVPGAWTVQILLQDGAGQERVLTGTAEVEPGTTGRLDIDAARGEDTLVVRVLGSDGGLVMLVGVGVGLDGARDTRLAELTSPVTFSGLHPGRYQVCVVGLAGGRRFCQAVAVARSTSVQSVDLDAREPR